MAIDWTNIKRRKTFTELLRRPYRKPLSMFNMNRIDVASTLGIGVFILIGYVTRAVAGPSIMVAMAIATTAIGLLTGFYYAELSTRIPEIGSVYVYSYALIGEWAAFLIGWHLILEYIIGIAAIGKVIGYHIDSLLNELIRLELARLFPMDIEWTSTFMSDYFDIFGFSLVICLGAPMLICFRRSEFMNKILLLITISAMLFTIIAGAFKGNTDNWNAQTDSNSLASITTTSHDIRHEFWTTEFCPFGVVGLCRAVAILAFTFVGLDSGHNSKTQQSTFFGFLWYLLASLFLMGGTIIMTMLFPYYLLDEYAPLPQSFNEIGWLTAQWIISIGGILTLIASFLGLIFPLQRILCQMINDGLLLESFGGCGNNGGIFGQQTTSTTKMTIPTGGICCSMLMASLFAGLFTVGQLIDFLAIGTLFSFFIVALSIILLSFGNSKSKNARKGKGNEDSVSTVDIATTGKCRHTNKEKRCLDKFAIIFNYSDKEAQHSTEYSCRVVRIALILYCLTSLAISLTVKFSLMQFENGEIWVITVTTILCMCNIFWIILLARQPIKNTQNQHVLFVPFLPAASMFLDIFLLVWLSPMAWIRFVIWTILGGLMYTICLIKYRRPIVQNDIMKKEKQLIGLKKCLYLEGPQMLERSWSTRETLTQPYNLYIPPVVGRSLIGDNLMDIIEKNNHDFINNDNNKNDDIKTMNSNQEIIENGKENITSTTMEAAAATNKLPSPSTSLDDIVLCSEIVDTLTERKEPNGKTYFIDNNDQQFRHRKSTEIDDQTTAIAFLDDVLSTEEIVDEKSIEEFDRALKGSPVTAIIHLSQTQAILVNDDDNDIDDHEMKKQISANECNDELNKKLTIEIPTPDYNSDSPTINNCSEPTSDEKSSSVFSIDADSFEYIVKSDKILDSIGSIGDGEAQQNNNIVEKSSKTNDQTDQEKPENESKKEKEKPLTTTNEHRRKSSISVPDLSLSMSFKDRLAMLLGQQQQQQQQQPQQNPVKLPRKNIRKLNDTEHIETAPIIRLSHAKSEPDIMRTIQKNTTDLEATNLNVKIPRVRLLNSDDLTTQSMTLAPSTIPPPPKFDPDVYRTLGSKLGHTKKSSNRPTLLTITPNTTVRSDQAILPTPMMDDPDTDEGNDNNFENNDELDKTSRMNRIKNKLETIFKKGPPQNRYSRSGSMPSSPVVMDIGLFSSQQFDLQQTSSAIPLPTSTIISDDLAVDQEAKRKFNFKEIEKPFDTVHKQKILFEDVLKSISSNERPTLRPTSPNCFATSNSTVF